MTSENVEVVRRLLEAFERDDRDAQYTVQGGKITRMEFFTKREQADRAAGLSQPATNSEESR